MSSAVCHTISGAAQGRADVGVSADSLPEVGWLRPSLAKGFELRASRVADRCRALQVIRREEQAMAVYSYTHMHARQVTPAACE